ncbi:metallophosphoesterase [Rummeliibacillus sp. TYF005]|uniref:metallophosphoesterase n=1 Tax=Rummeliibacillus sp. TYF005 TaxID=2058214 RepID=UPI000F534449|nr:metallophosphoesterase [Rummeliibacillus sp. TYF005]RPJ95212.1 metallophosphoesterase [Rummeliibacillus sp. TYF005]
MSKLTIVFAISLALLIYGGANLYIGHRLYRGLVLIFTRINKWVFACVYGVIAFIYLLQFLPLPGAINELVTTSSSYWLGIFVYLLLWFVVIDVVIFIGKLCKLIPSPVPKVVRLCSWGLAILCTIGFVGYGIYNATQIKEVKYKISTKDSVVSPQMKIVVISDLHLGAIQSENRLEEIVEKINAMKPDLIAIPGDIFNDDFDAVKNPKRVSELFKQLEAPYGVYATLGNHDGGKTFHQMVKLLKDSNIMLLKDEYVIIDDRFALAGRLDSSPIRGYGGLKRKDMHDSLAKIDPKLPLIVLDHKPSHLEEYSNNVDLILSGHTHKGQIFPGSLITNQIYVVDYGHYQKNPKSPHVIVTSGVGTWGMPMRVGTNNEIVEILLD